ncbi:unnamed protein product, partial [Rotaria magnacalcarata]
VRIQLRPFFALSAAIAPGAQANAIKVPAFADIVVNPADDECKDLDLVILGSPSVRQQSSK